MEIPHFTIRPEQAGDYLSLCQHLQENDQIPSQILHCWSITAATDNNNDNVSTFKNAQKLGYYSLIHLVQALSHENINDPLEIIVVSNNAQSVTGNETLQPEKATLFGVCRSIIQECFTISCRSIDLDADLPLASLITELNTNSTELEVAYRAGERFVRTYEPFPLEADPAHPLRQNGTYLITGGLGGVGLILAQHLAQTWQANLVLTSRSGLPKRDTWAQHLAEGPDTDSTVQKIRQIQALEEAGATVRVLKADVSDKAEMKQALDNISGQFGQLHGVIHAAGISDGYGFDTLQTIRPHQCEAHFGPKVYGLYVLQDLLADQELDFCILFSSVSSVLGGLGFVGYTAANIFIDTFTHQHNRQTTQPWLSVNWDTWQLRADQHDIIGRTVAEYEMTPDEGVQAFEHVLGLGEQTQLINSTGDLNHRIREWIQLESIHQEPTELIGGTARPELESRYVAPAGNYEQTIVTVWQEVLGFAEIGIYDNFFDLGGNSLIALQVIARLKKALDIQIPVVALFEAPTVTALATYLRPDNSDEVDEEDLQLSQRRKLAQDQTATQAVAIIGMAGRFPGAPTIDQFWQNLHDGVESVTVFTDEELTASRINPDTFNDPHYVKARPVLEDVDRFDAAFFGYSPREAELTDPQHRLFLECAWQALEQAGYAPKSYPGLISIFGGANMPAYISDMMGDPNFVRSLGTYEEAYQIPVGNDRDSLATMVSYKLNLKGPSLTVQTFCSTSLVATHLAYRSLLNGECDMALAGGASIRVPVKTGYKYVEQGGMESPDGHCRTFDARAEGTLFGDGVGLVLLKRLDDAVADGDQIYAVIRGSAMNNDGSLKVGYAAPSVEGQAQVIESALENAGITADQIDYVEAHGTATPIGDPIEVAALTKAFRQTTEASGYCALGSVKTNIGHVDRAAGVSGLIKTVLALKHHMIPPSLHFEEPNPEIDFANSPFFVNAKLSPWERNGKPRLAGVSSLGMGGTNVHIVLEEAPEAPSSGDSRAYQLLLLSARTEKALDNMTANLANYLRDNPTVKLADVAYTLQRGRTRFARRRLLVCRDREEALAILEAAPASPQLLTLQQKREDRPLAFMLPGLGDHYVQMGRDLYVQELFFQQEVDRCCTFLKARLGLDLLPILYPDEPLATSNNGNGSGQDLRAMLGRDSEVEDDPLRDTAVAQPALFVIEYALARLLIHWGLRPQALIGYSLGEYVAACLAGVLSLEDALTLVTKRAQLIASLPQGAMLAISSTAEAIESSLTDELSLGAVNGPNMCVVSGTVEAVSELETTLMEQGIACRRLQTTHAFHSTMMQPIAAELTRLVESVLLSPPRIPYISNVTGTWITPEQATDPTYWAQHLQQPVQFGAGITELLSDPEQMLVEVGPGYALGSVAKLHPDCDPQRGQLILSSLPHRREMQPTLAYLLTALGKAWLLGAKVNWSHFYEQETRHRLPLPTYPFERQSYWLEPSLEAWTEAQDRANVPIQLPESATLEEIIEASLNSEPEKIENLTNWFFIPSWKRTALQPKAVNEMLLKQKESWLIFLDECGVGEAIASRLQQEGHVVTTVQQGDAFSHLSGNEYALHPSQKSDYESLLKALRTEGQWPTRIAHLWTVSSAEENASLTSNKLESCLQLGFYSLMSLAQALGDLTTEACQLLIVSSDMQDVTGNSWLQPAKATLFGPYKVIPQEYTHLNCSLVDVTVPASGQWQESDLIEQLLGEFVDPTRDVVALRDKSRWVQSYEATPLAAEERLSPPLRANGVYLITGGLGGIGLALARYLVEQYQARIVLLNRSSLPPRQEWPAILESEGDEEGLDYKIRQVQDLEEMGAQVLVLQADVTDSAEVASTIEQAIAEFGTIHGLFHAAAVPPLGLIQLKTPERAAAVLAPKVKGTLHLYEALQDIPLDFMLFFSSMSAITGGGPGQVDYCAANVFLDAFARCNGMQNGLMSSIDWGEWQWDAWQEGLEGFPEEAQLFFKEKRRRFGISFEEGFEAMKRILSYGLPQVVVATQNFQEMIAGSDEFTGTNILEGVRSIRDSKHPRPALGTSYVAPGSDLERSIATIWSDLLGIDDIGVNDNFFELGGNSLVGIDMMTSLRKELAVENLGAFVIYEAPTIGSLAKFIKQDEQETDAIAIEEEEMRGSKRYQNLKRRRKGNRR